MFSTTLSNTFNQFQLNFINYMRFNSIFKSQFIIIEVEMICTSNWIILKILRQQFKVFKIEVGGFFLFTVKSNNKQTYRLNIFCRGSYI